MIASFLHALVRALAWIAPSHVRARWREEWLAEIDHVRATRGLRAALRLVPGALPDALSLRKVAMAYRIPERRSAGRASRVGWLDFKLGLRMLVKYPGLSLVAVLGMALAIAIGAGAFAFFYSFMNPTLPLDEGERVVAIENWDAAARNRENRTLHDFTTWRQELQSIADVGAYREVTRNLVTPAGRSERVRIAEMTASGFRLSRVAPLLGRPLIDADENEGSPAVVVIGSGLWKTAFDGDSAILGRTVRIGGTAHAVVGVMPDGFAFPVNHGVWVPLRADPSDFERRQGPAINVFGRLAPGISYEAAQAELTTIGLRTAAAFPATNAHLRPRLAPYTSLWFGDDMVGWHLHVMQILTTMLLVVVCVNVASLVYARTASRDGEIAIRSALGGSRGRIVTQLFVEALVLAAVAAIVGLATAELALVNVKALFEQLGGAPFWMGDGLSAGAVFYTAGLAVLGAAIVGVVPALKATGRRLEPGLRQVGGATGMRLGHTWTTLIVCQVALAVAVMPAAFSIGWHAIGYRTFDDGFAAGEFLTARVSMDRDVPPTAAADAYERTFARQFGARIEEVVQQLRAEPGVLEVTFASTLPGDEVTTRIDIDDTPARSAVKVRAGWVDLRFFDVFDIPLLTGRRFGPADLDGGAARPFAARRVPTISGKISQAVGSGSSGAPAAVATSNAVVVNRTFAQQVFGDINVLGRRLRYADGPSDPDAWLEIVGVVGDFPPGAAELTSADARVYHPVAPDQLYPATVAMRIRPNAASPLAGRLREIATSLDATLQVGSILSLDQVHEQEQRLVRLGASAFGAVTLSVLLLSAAGIYALTSFTVASRRREIGLRTALGAEPRRIVAGIFLRAFRQLAIGVAAGLCLAALMFEEITNSAVTSGHGAVLLVLVAIVMTTVGLIAALGPVRRSLRIDPAEALKAEQ
ncbi:MAG: ABC transporter permease [Vicinamibacterales bacterium]